MDDVIANIDHYRMGRVLINLVLNAIQAINCDEGEVGIVIKKNANNNLSIKVTDNGKGIEDADQEKIFDCFFTKGKRKGSGLGLAYCKNVVEAHGGSITVESEFGKGSVFTIKIPNVNSSCVMCHESWVMSHA